MQRKGLGLLLAAAAAYGYYRYSKMTPEQKNSLKEKGKKFVNDNLGGLDKVFGKKTGPLPAMAINRAAKECEIKKAVYRFDSLRE